MKNVFGMKKTVLAAAVAASLVAPAAAMADVSGSLGIANMYLWRGQDISAGRPEVFGSLDYTHPSGLYAGIWGSSEGPSDTGNAGTPETDLYAGYNNHIGGLNYDLSYIYYDYSGNTAFDLSEIKLNLGYSGFNATGYFGVGDVGRGSNATTNKNNYFTLSYGYDKYSILVGTWDMDNSAANYTHVDLSYALTDQLSFTLSKVVDARSEAAVSDSNDPLFLVSYSFKI